MGISFEKADIEDIGKLVEVQNMRNWTILLT